MRFRPNRNLTAMVAAATAIVLAGCGSSGATGLGGDTTTSGSPIVVGVSLPLTGTFSADGVAFQQGYQLWQTLVNNGGGILGRPVKLIILDDKSDPDQTSKDYQTLINVDHVDMTFGPFSSLLTKPAEEAVAPHGYAMIEGAGAAETVFNDAANKQYRNLFSPSAPVSSYMKEFDAWIAKLPLSKKPRNAAYPMAEDIFSTPAVQKAQTELQKLGITTVFTKLFPEASSPNQIGPFYQKWAIQIASLKPDLVVLGATDVLTVAEFMTVFRQHGYTPKIFIATSGPDQGKAFLDTPGVGPVNAEGMMVPGGWSGSYGNADSYAMVEQYIARYGGNAASVNADVAEAYSVGEVAAEAIKATGGTDNGKIIKYLHSGVTLQSVQGPVQFDQLGRNPRAFGVVFQWVGQSFNQVLPAGAVGTVGMPTWPKPAWGL